ncbi:ATP-binding protein [Natronolimnobius sp. AArcel1]|uniref:ATP-binding protein n=1 Tax=Natronolimnobius sp. AArcel1 TaxID=1679093 RepID=UPI0013EA1DB5|nr:AAA family ATPase [Natronolimnobius sp. AArcel1]NGM70800.1 ATP-binding protein [Natronolimnobius sp. AArcel1]
MSYPNTVAHLLAEIHRVHTILEHYRDGRPETTPGTAADSDRLDAAPRDETPDLTTLEYAISDSDHTAIDELDAEIERELRGAREDGVDLRLETLVDGFGLDDRHRDVLLIALLPDVEPAAEDLFTVLNNDVQKPRPTVSLIAELFSTTRTEFVAATELVGEHSPLRQHDLVVLEDDNGSTPKLNREIRVDDHISDYLLGHDGIDPRLERTLEAHIPATLESHLTRTSADTTFEDLLLPDDLRADLESLPSSESGGRYYFSGPRGSGVNRAVEACCPSDQYLQADLRAVLEADALEALVREATIQDRPVQLSKADAATVRNRETDHTLEGVLARFRAFKNDVFVTGEQAWTPSASRRASVDAIVEFERPSIALRRTFWEDRADDLPAAVEPETMASTFDLTQGQLEAALATATSLAGGDDPTLEEIRAGCRAQSSTDLADLAQRVEPRKCWDDIELRESTERRLRTLETHITNRGLLYDDWGFRAKDGNAGIVSLFKGLPGTGKTLAAEVLANSVGMDLYKIDLSSVISKYIGETEENLEQIFRAAEQSNAILLFDEADSIFGDRAEVSDATDRYANVEVNYLLQRVETYDGVIVLTTNYAQNIDAAFSRRITHSITFEKPDAATRERIWEGIFPDNCPVEAVDWEWLAEFEYSGGDIDKLAKHVAIYGADREAETITMPLVVQALEQYKRDRNSPIREADFEPYLEHLEGPTEREARTQIQEARRRS